MSRQRPTQRAHLRCASAGGTLRVEHFLVVEPVETHLPVPR